MKDAVNVSLTADGQAGSALMQNRQQIGGVLENSFIKQTLE